MDDFEIGDVVALKSGSPKMTILDISGTALECAWFLDGKPEFAQFPKEAVNPAN